MMGMVETGTDGAVWSSMVRDTGEMKEFVK